MTIQVTECNKKKTNPAVIADLTIKTLKKSVPGIIFSDSLSEEAASVYLNLMNKIIRKANWNIGFSYGRALQHSCLKAWKGDDVTAGQKALLARARANSEASKGCYVAGSQPSSDEALFVAGYKY